QVENELFKIPTKEFVASADVFASMFSLPSSGQPQGTDQSNPMVLEGYKKAEFVALLKVLYPSSASLAKDGLNLDLSKEEWSAALKLATVWGMQPIRDFAISRLSSPDSDVSLSPLDKIIFGRTHRVAKWLREGLVALTESPLQPLAELKVLDWETVALIYCIRD
ncbi:hypothetical protein FA15DRAFT_547194, partial [Coprinopsis marcescibilis]